MIPNPKLPVNQGTAVLPALPPWLAYTQGNIWHQKPYNGGASGATGKSPRQAVKTLTQLLALMAANQNDIGLMYAEHNDTVGNTTDYQVATLDWNKDLCHLIGVNGGSPLSPRSRIAFKSDYAAVSPLMTVSADGCYFANLGWYMGVADATPVGCLNVTGSRNRFENCHIAGIGHDNNDIENAYSLRLAGSENFFKNCVIGLDTIKRGTADNSEIVFAGGAARNVFEDCLILSWAEANTHQFVKRAASASDRFNLFRRSTFINFTLGGGVAMLEAFDLAAGGSPAGVILLDNCSLFGAAEWEAAAGVSGILFANMPAASVADGGVAGAVTGA